MKCLLAILYMLTIPLVCLSDDISLHIITKKYTFAPGTTTSMPITLVNSKHSTVEYEIAITSMSSKIEIFHTKKTISIAPQKKETLLLPINISKDCPVGTHQLVLKVLEKMTTDYQIFDIEINVSQKDDITIVPLIDKEYIKAGDTINSKFSIKNLGNIDQIIELSSNNGLIEGSRKISLAPQEEKIITITKATDPKEKKTYQQLIDLNVQRYTDKLTNKLTAYYSINIIPINPLQLDIYKRWPVQASLLYINMRQSTFAASGWQGELFTKGSLTDDQNNNIEIKLTSKNPVRYSSYAQYEEYYAKYNNEKLAIHIGDKAYSSSYLTEFSRYGRGLEINYEYDKINFGFFYNKPRFFNKIQNEFNVYSKFDIDNKNNITLGFLQKNILENSIITPHYLPYVLYKSSFIKKTIIETEYAFSKAGNSTGSAFRLQTTTQLNKLFANFSFLLSNPTFMGYFRNSRNLNGSINYTISSKLNISANHYQGATNYQRDTLLLAAPLQKNSQLGVNYKYSNSGSISVFNGYMSNKDRLSLHLFQYDEIYVRSNLNQNLGILHFNYNIHFGYTNNQISNIKGNSYLNNLNISYNQGTTYLSIFGSIAKTARYNNNSSSVYYGGRIGKNFRTNTSINLLYQNNYMPEEYFTDRNQFEGIVRQTINNNHSLELIGRYMIHQGTVGNKDFLIQLKYLVNLNIPYKKVKEYTNLEGKIYSRDLNKLDGIPVKLGNQITITDKNGYYKFKNVIPGNYYFDIEKSNLPLNTIADIILPTTLLVDNPNKTIKNIELSKASKIRGKIILYENASYNSINDHNRINNETIIVEANNGEQIIRKICKLKENYDFTHLRPGIWTIKIYANTLSKNLKIVKDAFDINLNAGEEQELDIEIKVSQKEIRFQQDAIKVTYKSNNE